MNSSMVNPIRRHRQDERETKLHGGLLFLFRENDKKYWEDAMGEAFHVRNYSYEVIGYDWHGRILAVTENSDKLIAFDPASDAVLDFGVCYECLDSFICSIDDPFDIEGYSVWKQEHGEVIYGDCVSFIIPFYLNGENSFSNMQYMSLALYWNLSTQIAVQVRDLPEGTVIEHFSIEEPLEDD